MAAPVSRLGVQLTRRAAIEPTAGSAGRPSRRAFSAAALTPRRDGRVGASRGTLTLLAAPPPALSSSSSSSSSSSAAAIATSSSVVTPSLCTIRCASTQADAEQPSGEALDWNSFFRLRTSRRRYALASSIITSAASTAGAVAVLTEMPDISDAVTKLIPTDPIISMGIATFGATFFGWLIGPAFGNTIWRLLHQARLREFTTKERAFFERIKRHRVNPSGASTNNPVPDFYGEKVGSVAGYRRWLKDQRAFNRKRGGTYTTV